MAQLQSSCVLGTLSISASDSNAQCSIYILGAKNNAEFNGQCNLIAIGENTALTGSGGLDITTLTMTQNGCNFCPNYGYYQRNSQGCHKPVILTGGGGGTGAVIKGLPTLYTNYYAGIDCGFIGIDQVSIQDPGKGYTSTVTGTICDPSTTGETCALFTIEPLTNQNSINIGHSAGCRSQGSNNIRIGTCAGKGNLNNSYCLHTNSIAIGTNTMLSGSFIDSIAIGENALKGNMTCTNAFRCIKDNVVIGKNSLCKFTQRTCETVIVGSCNIPDACCTLRNTIIGFCNGKCICSTSAYNVIIGYCNIHACGTNKNMGNSNVKIGFANSRTSGCTHNNVQIGNYNMCGGAQNSANYNIALGYQNLRSLTTGDVNIAMGYTSGYCTTTGYGNIYLGCRAGFRNCTGARSIFIGCNAGCGMGNQNDSIFIGPATSRYGGSNQGGHIVIGIDALRNMCAGYFNTVIGYGAMCVGGQTSTSCAINGGCNIAIGPYAGQCVKANSNNNIYIGQRSGPTSFGAETYKFYLGQGSGNHLMCGCLNSSGRTLCVNGTISKTGGSFAISHPDPSKNTACELWHSFVESPTAGDNLYRFKVEVKNGTTTIDLPDYYKYLNKNDQVWVNAKNHFGRAYGVVNQEQSTLTVFADTDGDYNVLLIGTRKDKDAVKFWKGTERLKEN